MGTVAQMARALNVPFSLVPLWWRRERLLRLLSERSLVRIQPVPPVNAVAQHSDTSIGEKTESDCSRHEFESGEGSGYFTCYDDTASDCSLSLKWKGEDAWRG